MSRGLRRRSYVQQQREGRTHGKKLVHCKAEGLDVHGCQVAVVLHGSQADLLCF